MADQILNFNGNKKEIESSLRHFNKCHSVMTNQTPTVVFSQDNLRSWWTRLLAIIHDESSNTSNTLYLEALTAVKILTRQGNALNVLIDTDCLQTLFDSAQLCVNQGDEPVNVNAILESQKALSNIILRCRAAQKLCEDGVLVRMIVFRLQNTCSLLPEIEYFDLRLLFLITALCPQARETSSNALETLMDVLERILRDSSSENWRSVCEVLRCIFNFTLSENADTTKSEVQKFSISRLVSVICVVFTRVYDLSDRNEKKSEIVFSAVNIITNLSDQNVLELLKPSETYIDGRPNNSSNSIHLEFINIILQCTIQEIKHDKAHMTNNSRLLPGVLVLTRFSRLNSSVRKYLRFLILPPLREAKERPELGSTPRNKFCSLLTSSNEDVANVVSDFLFVLCKQKVGRMIKYTGYGNSAGLFARKGLMTAASSGKSDTYDDSEDSETEEYSNIAHKVNPVIGCVEEPRVSILDGMSDEQKEYEANKLINLIDKLNRRGVIQPMRTAEDGSVAPLEHVLQLLDDAKQHSQNGDDDD